MCFKELLTRSYENFQADSDERKMVSKNYISQRKYINFTPKTAVQKNPCVEKFNKCVIVINS